MTPRSPDRALLAYVGCRTTAERDARGKGLSVYEVNVDSGAWTEIQRLDGLVNPSYLCFGPEGRHLYVVHGDQREVSTFVVDPPTGALRQLGTVSCGGENPVHLTPIDHTTLAIANYATGSVSILDIDDDGSLRAAPRQVLHLARHGGRTTSHPHQILPDRRSGLVVVPDKGSDKVFLLETVEGEWTATAAATCDAGAGPRHAVLHPQLGRLYVVNELASSVTTYRFDRTVRTLTALQTLPTVPADARSSNTAAGIVTTFDYQNLYISNRGHDSVAHFRVDGRDGLLSLVGHTHSGGAGPRFLTFDPTGSKLYVANERGDSIIPFTADRATGALRRDPVTVHTGSPVCIAFAAAART